MFILGAGMITAVGLSAPSSCAAMRARISRFVEVPYTDRRNEPVVGAPVRQVSSTAKGSSRLVDLAAPALLECASAVPAAELTSVPVLLGIAGGARPAARHHPVELVDSLRARTGLSFAPERVIFADGAMAAVKALAHARMLLRERRARWCIAGGVDSFLDQRQLRWLEDNRRLKRPNEPDGVVPGEAACFILLGASTVAGSRRAAVTGIGAEMTTPDGPPRLRGADVVSAMRAALRDAGIRTSDVAVLITDMTGERDLGVDHALAVARTFTEFQPRLHYWHTAMSLGSVGAASTFCALAWAAESARRGYAPGAHAMCLSVSETTGKGAALVSLESV